MKISRLAFAMLLGALVTSVPLAFGHTYSGAPSMVTFSPSTILTAANLNQAFAHVHNTFGNIVDAHVSASAAISHAKFAGPPLVPKAWSTVGVGSGTPITYAACAADPCTLGTGYRVTGVKWSGAGLYDVTLSFTPTSASQLGVIITPLILTADGCTATNFKTSAPQFRITCGAASVTNSAFTFVVFDYAND